MRPPKDRRPLLRPRKAILCRDWKKNENSCQYGKACAFAHGYLELHNIPKELKGDEIGIKKWYEGQCSAGTINHEETSRGSEVIKEMNSLTALSTPISEIYAHQQQLTQPRTLFNPSIAPFTPTKTLPVSNSRYPQPTSVSLKSFYTLPSELTPSYVNFNSSTTQEVLLSQLCEKTSLASRLNMKVIALTDYQSGSKKRIQLLEKRISALERSLKESNTEAAYLRGHNAVLEDRIVALHSGISKDMGLTKQYQESLKYINKLERQRKQLAKLVAKLLAIKIDTGKKNLNPQLSKNEEKEKV